MAIRRLEEASRNELLALAKSDTITRYNKSASYKGFSIIDINTSDILRDNTLVVTCRVGDYNDVVALEDILYWVQIVAEEENSAYHKERQVTTKVVTKAIMNSIDGMDIKIDCSCPDFKYRFAYQATILGYKYGKPENRPANVRNPKNYGSMCKHLISMLSNKKWLQQVTSKFMDWIVANIDEVNAFLKPKEGQELTLSTDIARSLAKGSWRSRRGKQNQNTEDTDAEIIDNNDNIENEE